MKSLTAVYDLTIRLDVKRETDQGVVLANKLDDPGTPVLFNKPFRDVDSITLTARSAQAINCVYIFDDVPNPTGFSVQAYGFAPTGRVDAEISWIARGIV